ncbi:MAG: hypothetical protein KDK60_01635 [Chlamydiia bacterium]|nr:hypothetical protein [Chlamydiia bacterium]
MMRLSQQIKKWGDFSKSPTKPLFWMLLGPLLVILTLIFSLSYFSNPFLPLITMAGLVMSWRFRVSGFALTLMTFIFYFAFHYFFGHHDALLWKIGWGASLALGVTISFLSMEELKSYFVLEKERKEKAMRDLQLSLHSSEEKAASEKRVQEKEVESLKEELTSAREEIEALLGLVDACQIEANKVAEQHATLSIESLSMHREIELYKISDAEKQEQIESLKKEHEALSLEVKKRLKTLNTYRVELLQSRMLFEEQQGQLKRARDYFHAQKKSAAPPKQENKALADRGQHLVLQTLEQDKGKIKSTYNQILHDTEALQRAIEEGELKLKKAPDEALSKEVAHLTSEMKEKKKFLQQTKSELIGIEREIFVLKKQLQHSGTL